MKGGRPRGSTNVNLTLGRYREMAAAVLGRPKGTTTTKALAQLAKRWGVTPRTVERYWSSTRKGAGVVTILRLDEYEREREARSRLANSFQWAEKEVAAYAPHLVERLRADGSCLPSEMVDGGADAVNRMFEERAIGMALTAAKPSEVSSLVRQLEDVAQRAEKNYERVQANRSSRSAESSNNEGMSTRKRR